MRSSGQRIPGSDPGFRRGVQGLLTYKQSPLDDYGPRWEAHLKDQSGKELLLPLYWARIRRIEGGVLHLAGIEEDGRKATKARPERWKQSWLCAVDREDAMRLLVKVYVPGREEDNDETDDAHLLVARWGAP